MPSSDQANDLRRRSDELNNAFISNRPNPNLREAIDPTALAQEKKELIAAYSMPLTSNQIQLAEARIKEMYPLYKIPCRKILPMMHRILCCWCYVCGQDRKKKLHERAEEELRHSGDLNASAGGTGDAKIKRKSKMTPRTLERSETIKKHMKLPSKLKKLLRIGNDNLDAVLT